MLLLLLLPPLLLLARAHDDNARAPLKQTERENATRLLRLLPLRQKPPPATRQLIKNQQLPPLVSAVPFARAPPPQNARNPASAIATILATNATAIKSRHLCGQPALCRRLRQEPLQRRRRSRRVELLVR